ncbi:phage holin family protein [Nibribacter ruber]|uniref:Phage holin family protein n=1 Tax=Nibribacter ruber TaxID=2698458 RepID=A0A6P1NT58_9BACT|nr:phage holin family protein [Nibribacter ruber]QHL86220.1 phage holin family protein [Nibribacter ruber]
MSFIIKIILTGIAALVLAKFIPGIVIDGVLTALILALVLAILNAVVKPILVFLTIPITFMTLGLFLLVINVIILYLADYLVDGFNLESILGAIIFSLAMSVITTIIDFVRK